MLKEGVKFPIWIQLICRYWLPRILSRKSALKLLVLPHIIVTKTFIQEFITLHRICTAGLEFHIFPQVWVNTIK